MTDDEKELREIGEQKKKLQDLSQGVLDMFQSENSSLCILALLNVIDHLSSSNKGSTAFKQQTARLLKDQHDRSLGYATIANNHKTEIKPELDINNPLQALNLPALTNIH